MTYPEREGRASPIKFASDPVVRGPLRSLTLMVSYTEGAPMSDPLAPYANETPEQAAERARQQEEQRALEAGEKNVPPAAPPPEPLPDPEATRSKK